MKRPSQKCFYDGLFMIWMIQSMYVYMMDSQNR